MNRRRSYLLASHIALLVFLPVATQMSVAQTHSEPLPQAPAKPEPILAKIDPLALNLLARVADKYSRARYYSGVIDWSFGEEGKPQTKTRFRVALSSSYGVISKADENGTERWATNGSALLGTASRRPKKYVLLPSDDTGYWRSARDTFFRHAGFEGALPDLITGRIAQILLDPSLRSVSFEPTTEDDATQKTVISVEGQQAGRNQTGTVTLYIDSNLVLRRFTMRDSMPPDAAGISDERYSEIVMGRDLPADFFKQTSVKPPKGFTRIETFDEELVSLSPPVNNDPTPKKAAPKARK